MKFYELFIAWRYMTANIKQSLIIIVAIGIGVAIIIWIPSVNTSFFNDLINKSVSSAPHITVTKELDTFERNKNLFNSSFNNKILLEDQTVTRKRNIISPKTLEAEIKNVKGVTETARYVSGQAFVIRGAKEEGVSIKGIVPEDEVKVTNIQGDMIKGSIKNLSINDIVIGIMLADKLKVSIGNKLIVTGPRGDTKTLKISGIFSTGLRSKDERQIYVNLKSGQQILRLDNEVSGIGIKVDDIYTAEKIARQIEKNTGLDVKSWQEDNKQILDQINRFKLIMLFMNFLVLFSAASSITSVFIFLVASKAKEIGILKSMGAKNNSIMTIFFVQAITLGFIGYTIGLLGANLLLMGYANLLSSSQGTLLGTEIPELKVNISYAFLAFFNSIFISFIASIIPSYQAAKLNPVEAING